MDSQLIKDLVLEARFDKLEEAASLEKGLKWFTKKLDLWQSKPVNNPPPNKFVEFLLASCSSFEHTELIEKAKLWNEQQKEAADSLDESDGNGDVEGGAQAEGDVVPFEVIVQGNMPSPLPLSSLALETQSTSTPIEVSPPAKEKKSAGDEFQIPAKKFSPPGAGLDIDKGTGSSSSSSSSISVTPPKAVKQARVSKAKETTENKPTKQKTEKNLGAPKAKNSAYVYFCNDQRVLLKQTQPELKPPEVMRALGKAWKDAPEAVKEPFLMEANKDAKRYKEEMEQYVITHPDAASKGKGKGEKKSHKSKRKSSKVTKMPTISESDEEDEHENEDEEEGEEVTGTPAPVFARMGSKRRASFKKSYAYKSDDEDNEEEVASSTTVTPPPKKQPKVTGVSSSRASVQALQKDRVKRAAQASVALTSSIGVKQSDLSSQDDLLHANLILHKRVSFPPDYIPELGTSASLILKPYREFLSSLSLQELDVEQREALERPCAFPHNILTGDVMQITQHVATTGADGKNNHTLEGTYTVILREHASGDIYSVLFAPFSSALLQTDEFLHDAKKFDAALKKPYLIEGAQVKKLFALGGGEGGDGASDDGVGDAMWMEGSLYHVPDATDMQTDPYQCLKVVWLSQEKDTNDWVFAYMQTDCEVSPWELEPSDYVLAEDNQRVRKLPSSLKVGSLVPSAIFNYFKILDCSTIFLIPIAEVSPEYVEMFPNKEDILDLHIIANWLEQGRYAANRNDSNSAALGISTLLNDLEHMVHNAKLFNQSNTNFLPWRQADMAATSLTRLRKQLIEVHPELITALADSGKHQRQKQQQHSSSSVSLEIDLDAEI